MEADTIRILLADDHDLARRVLADLLRSEAGLEVVGEAEEGGSAVNLARELEPDVVVMDVVMPGVNGIEATRRILSELPTVRILATSMFGDGRFVESMLQAGASGYLLKEDATEELVVAVQAVAHGGRYLSRHLERRQAARAGWRSPRRGDQEPVKPGRAPG